MIEQWSRDGVTIHGGDCLKTLRSFESASVHCCVTSPPYWGLRDYGTATWEGGDQECDHIEKASGRNDVTPERLAARAAEYGTGQGDGSKVAAIQYRDVCGRCGARRVDNQIGLEATLDEYVTKMVAVFAEVRRVLRDDGTLWLNLGDTYLANQGTGFNGQKRIDDANRNTAQRVKRPKAIKPKDLAGVPWRVAFALQADGWYLRQDIIWHKPNPMPESVTDRCTKAHEYIFILAKSQRYYFDQEAIKEDSIDPESLRPEGRSPRNQHAFETSDPTKGRTRIGFQKLTGVCYPQRNKRSVWTVNPKPYPKAHFATFPPDLIEPCILAGCPEGGTVLDPFLGSGTTAAVAQKYGRQCVGIELNREYVELCIDRFEQKRLFA